MALSQVSHRIPLDVQFLQSLEGTIKQMGLDFPHWTFLRRDSESLDLPVPVHLCMESKNAAITT